MLIFIYLYNVMSMESLMVFRTIESGEKYLFSLVKKTKLPEFYKFYD